MHKPLLKTRPSTSRQKLLDSPVHVLPLPPGSADKLVKMGFKTVRDAFRAALVGRLNARKKGGTALEDAVLESGCIVLGHPILTRTDLKDFRLLDNENKAGDVVYRFNGRPTPLPPELLASSIRDILLPSTMHNAIENLGIKDIAELLETRIASLLALDGIGPANLGFFLAHVFDYIFILHEQEAVNTGIDPETLSSRKQPFAGSTESLLATWLGEEMVAKGKKLLNDGQPVFTLFFRNTVGAIMTEGRESGIVYLSLTAPREDNLAFHISAAACDLCSPKARYQPRQCRHIAALAISTMSRSGKDQDCCPPLPCFSPDSPWQVIGRILFELFGQGGAGGTTVQKKDDAWQIEIPGSGDRPWATWLLNQETIAMVAALFDNKFQWRDRPPEIPNRLLLTSLQKRILDVGRTTAEAELNAFNKRSTLQEKDESIWIWLSFMLYRDIPPQHIALKGPGQEGLFNLTATAPDDGRVVFRMTIPRAKTPELVDCLHLYENCRLLPPATAATRVTMEDDGSVKASSLLRLADGRVFNRHDLEDHLYGRYYYIPAEGFLPVREQDPEHTIAPNPNAPTIFSPNKVPELLDKYHNALAAAENEIEPDLLDLRFAELPDRLEVNSFSADDDWCYLAGEYGFGSRHISLAELLTARMEKNKFLAGGRNWLKLTNTPLDWFHSLGKERLWHDEETGAAGVRLTRREMLMLSAQMPELKIKETAKGAKILDHLLDTDRWVADDHLMDLPAHLRDYQRHGIAWLYQIYRNRLAGILADDMGLGKTHQALALLKIILAGKSAGRFLVVCPATVVPHWVEKINEFFPSLSHYVYHGSRRDMDKAGDSSIFITTYGIIRRDTVPLADFNFEVIFLDEIQNVKNKKTDIYKAVKKLKGEVIIGLTGTPLENSVNDLKAIFDICLPGFLGSDRDFKSRYVEPIEAGGNHAQREGLSRLISPFLLRRTRQQVLTELPDIIEDSRACELSDDQVGLYRELINSRARAITESLDPEQEDSKLPYMELLAVINYLKQVCDHPCLVKNCDDPNRFRSGKWDLFVELLNECLESGMKVVVFSHYTRMLDIIERHLTALNLSFCRLRGDMPMAKRYEMIKKFNTDESCRVFSASLLAGGVGVDLTAAQAVIHYDRWWNAAREDQATARVHRMGQKNVVQVFKLFTVGTLEEKINQIISKKRDLADHLVREDDSSIIKRLSRQELIELLSPP